MPALTGRDEPRHFFHFWRYHFWPKLASCMLNFCRKRRSFQWCPDQSDRPNGSSDMHKNAQIVEWKTQSKISWPSTWLLPAKICPSWWRFLRLSLQQKEKKSTEQEGEKKIQKSKSLKWRLLSCPSQNFDFCACPSHNGVKCDAGGKEGKLLCCKCIFDWIKANLAKIQLKKHQNVQKMHFCKKFQESMG